MSNKCYKEINLTEQQREELIDEILTGHQPLGSKVYEYTNPRFDRDLYQFLFNWHPDHFVEDKGFRPAIILGRRGSGKSSYLNNLSHKEVVLSVPVRSVDLVDLVEANVKVILESRDTIDAEKVADIWLLVVLTLATRELGQLEATRDTVAATLKNFPVSDILRKTVSVVVEELLSVVREKFLRNGKSNIDFSAFVDSLGIGQSTLHGWESSISAIAKKAGRVVVVMIDNPERLDTSTKPSVSQKVKVAFDDVGVARWQTFAGLLSFISQFNEGKVGVQARYCVPAEQYFFLQERSAAILKDFSNVQVLHWTSGEILSALAHRYMVYLQMYPENRDDNRYSELLKIPIYTREGAFDFFNMVFEQDIKNDRNHLEDTVVYLLRHTQLLPRQIIIYLNEAIRLALDDDVHYDVSYLESKFIKKAINNKEELCAIEIVNSYSATYPEGGELINTISLLPALTTVKEIKQIWAKVDAKKILSKYQDYFPNVVAESDRFLRFLVEVGVMGKVQKESNPGGEGYVNAVFEYTLPQKISLADSDELAMHPIFSKQCRESQYKMLNGHKGVYPKGTEMGPVDKLALKLRYMNN